MPRFFAKGSIRAVRDEGGFTLIELLVVVIIIGILAAIAIPTYLAQRQRAYDADAQSTARVAVTAAIAYYQDNSTYDGLTAATLDSIEPTLPNNQNVAPYAPGTYTVTETNTDFTIIVRHPQGSRTFVSTNAGMTVAL